MRHQVSASQVSSTAVLELSQPPCAEVPEEFNIFNENSNYSQGFSEGALQENTFLQSNRKDQIILD